MENIVIICIKIWNYSVYYEDFYDKSKVPVFNSTCVHIIFGKRDCEGQNYRGLAHLALQVRPRARRNFAPPFSGRKS